MHAEFKAQGIYFMASDGLSHEAATQNSVVLNINFSDVDEQTACFEKLTTNGVILMPLERTFWGANFGKVQDQFGVQWMLNCHLDASN